MKEAADVGIIMTSMDEDLDSELMTDDEDRVGISATDRYDAARWLRKRVGVVAARDLPAEPSEEDFRQGLRSGMILCKVLNKIRSGSVPKIVNAPSALFSTPDAEAQAAYCENVRNFLIAMEELGLPKFDPSDLEPEGDFSNVVDSVLAMKAYSETGASDFTWTPRPSRSRKTFLRRNSEPAMNAFSRCQSINIDQLLGSMDDEDDLDEECDSGPLYMIVCDLLEDREEDDIPIIVENILNKVKEEFQSRLGLTTEDYEEEELIQEKTKKQEHSSIEDNKVAKEQERIKREKELQTLQEKAKKKEEEEKAAKEQERINKEKELQALQEKAKKQEEDEKAAKEQERINREKELLALQEKAKKEEEERAAKEKELLEQKEKARKEEEERIKREQELERIKREKELLEQKEKARKEEEERIKREKREFALKEKARKKEEARIKREKQILAQKAKARKEEQERIRREKRELAKKEKARKREEERIRRENLSLAQKEKAREEQERIKKEIELLALQEKAKEEEICAIEAERINREKELLEEEEKDRKEEEEQERIEREKEKERARKKDEYKRTMDEYKKIKVNTPKQRELVGQQDKDLQELRSTISTAKTDVRSMQNNCQEEADGLGTHVDTLCQAAAGYKKVLEENRKLYNQVQDLKGSIRVYCRIRPFLPGQENRITSVDYTDDETVAIIVPSKSGREGRKASMFNRVFGPSATQEEVFSDTQPLIRSVLDGFNVCVFACGQTGSGKTYTLTGPEQLTPETMGVNFRALNDLFLTSEERKNLINYEISITMLEIYNDEIRDLLVTDGSSKTLEICHPAKKGINVPDANLVPVSSTDEVMNLVNLCKKNRALNDHSSRAHTFLTAHVFGKDLTAGTTTRGCMHLVDLAGNEKLDPSDEEATHINKSHSALGDILVALANKSKNVPYKASKLTQMLQDAIGAQAKILMFVHVHPDISEALETLNTFKFVERFSTLEGGCGKSSDVRELKEQICYLKSALAKKEAGDPHWQELLNSPRSGDQNGGLEDDDEKTKKQPSAKSASVKKAAAGAVAAVKMGKQQSSLDSKKKKGK